LNCLSVAIIASLLSSSIFCSYPALSQTQPTKSIKQKPQDPAHKQAVQLLDEATAAAGALEPASQAALFFIIGRTYASFDKAKARSSYEVAYQNMRAALASQPAHPEFVGFLAPDLIQSTVEVAPKAVEQSLPPGWFRDIALASLTTRYTRQKQYERAMELLLMMESDEAMTVPARDLLMVLPRQDDRDQVFTTVLNAYSKNPHRQVGTGAPEDLGTLVVRFWQKLSPGLVHQAIKELLEQAKDGDSIVMKSPQGTVTFSSYQFRLFQILPALRAIDPEEADALLKDQQDVVSLLTKYPQGQQSADPSLRDAPMNPGEQREISYTYVHDVGQAAPVVSHIEADRAMDNLIVGADSNPDSAIANAAHIADRTQRLLVLVAIALRTATKHPSSAKSALREALKSPPENDRNWRTWKDAAEVSLQINDAGLADSMLQAGLKAARRIYDDEADSDNPNEALKLYWVSIRAYRELIAVQLRISTDAALITVRNLPDPEIEALEKVMLAADLIKAPLPETSPMIARKRDVERK
jgi:hypothetical protein